MRLFLLMLFVAVAMASKEEEAFVEWIVQHSKVYSPEDFEHRFHVWQANNAWIKEENNKNHSYTLGMNHLGDLTTPEYRILLGYRPRPEEEEEAHKGSASAVVPDVDWVAHGVVNPVRNQLACGSCWAFSTVCTIESANAIAGRGLLSLSEQQLVDCAGSEGNQGCNGGEMMLGFQYVVAHGLAEGTSYPYRARDGRCRFAMPAAKIASYRRLASNEEAMAEVLQTQPVAAALEADSKAFQFYHSGIFNDPACGTQLDHAVVITALGTDQRSQQRYWRIRNSWGSGWGDRGYINLLYGANMCGIAVDPSVPIA